MRYSLSKYHRSRAQSIRKREAVLGFTLVELMIVLVIVAVIMAVAAPGFSTLIERTRLKSFANEVVSSVYLARSEAIKRNAEVRMCASNNGEDCNAGGEWHKGWIVIDADNLVVNHQEPLPDGFMMFEISSVGFNEIVFQPSGLLSTSATMRLCQSSPEDGIEEKQITISGTGRPRVATTTTGCP